MNIPLSEVMSRSVDLLNSMNDPAFALGVALIMVLFVLTFTVASYIVQKLLPAIIKRFSPEKFKNDDPPPSPTTIHLPIGFFYDEMNASLPRYGAFSRSLQPAVQLEKRKHDESDDEKPKREEDSVVEWTIGDDGEIKEIRR